MKKKMTMKKWIHKIAMNGLAAVAGMAALTGCQPATTTVQVRVNGFQPQYAAVLMTKDSTYRQEFDANQAATFVLPGKFEKAYGAFYIDNAPVLLYVEPGAGFEATVTRAGDELQATFTGEGAPKNTYLHDTALYHAPDPKLEEADYIAAMDKELQREYAMLDARGFDEDFVTIEKKRLKYKLYENFPQYPSYHMFATWFSEYKPTEAFYNEVEKIFSEDETLLDMAVYQNFLSSYLSMKLTSFVDDIGQLQYTKNQLDFIVEHFKNPKVVSYLVHKAVYYYVENFGITDLPEFTAIYEAKVLEPEKKAALDALCQKWERIAAGQPSPDFACEDIDGKMVKLADFAGKYVYIDCWATWCGPCRREQPFLAELEKKYAGRNIAFVSISCDEDKDAWAKLVRDENLSGIQLYMGLQNTPFFSTYMVAAIPRFILIDREGKILAAHATRPSDPATTALFDSLEGL